MKHLLSGLDTVECAYYLRPGADCRLDFEALRAQKELLRQSSHPEDGVVQLGGTDFLMSPNGTRSGYPFLITNQQCAIQFGEFNEPGFFDSSSGAPKRYLRQFVGEIRFDGKRVVMRGKKAALLAAVEKEMGTARVPISVSSWLLDLGSNQGPTD